MRLRDKNRFFLVLDFEDRKLSERKSALDFFEFGSVQCLVGKCDSANSRGQTNGLGPVGKAKVCERQLGSHADHCGVPGECLDKK